MTSIDLEQKLENSSVIIDIEKLKESKIKQIVINNSQLLNLNCFDCNNNIIPKKEIINCLKTEDIQKAEKLNEIYVERIVNLVDDEFKKYVK